MNQRDVGNVIAFGCGSTTTELSGRTRSCFLLYWNCYPSRLTGMTGGLSQGETVDCGDLEAIGTGKCVVDLTCGSGELLHEQGDGFESQIGLDVSTSRMETMGRREDGRVFQHADRNFTSPLANEKADAEIANRVIEHAVERGHIGNEMRPSFSPCGRCGITTPTIRYLKKSANLLISGCGPRTAGANALDESWDDGHLHNFTHRNLRELLHGIGFSEVHSPGLIDLEHASWLRKLMDKGARSLPVGEVLSGNFLFSAVK